jgi:hypothetical protein
MTDSTARLPAAPWHSLSLERASRAFVTVLVLTLLALGIQTTVTGWSLADLSLYLVAAEELAAGGSPYSVVVWEGGLPYYYHYAPWFAAIFVPLTALPVELIRGGWSAILLAATGVAMIPMLRTHRLRAVPFAALLLFVMAGLISEGNVQPLLLLGLVWTLERRAGPVMIGIAASLKFVPILLALVYVGRRQWWRAAAACAVTGILLAPALLYEIPPHAAETGGTGLFSMLPILWAAVAGAAAILTLLLARSRFAWAAAATTSILALPRLLPFDISNLLAAFPAKRGRPA